jgi:hypothetical protein
MCLPGRHLRRRQLFISSIPTPPLGRANATTRQGGNSGRIPLWGGAGPLRGGPGRQAQTPGTGAGTPLGRRRGRAVRESAEVGPPSRQAGRWAGEVAPAFHRGSGGRPAWPGRGLAKGALWPNCSGSWPNWLDPYGARTYGDKKGGLAKLRAYWPNPPGGRGIARPAPKTERPRPWSEGTTERPWRRGIPIDRPPRGVA